MLDFIQDIVVRQWNDLLARPSGPLSFRFLLQPVMAGILAVRAGLRDARLGRQPYFKLILTDAAARGQRIRRGLAATSRIAILGFAMDAIYQVVALKKFYPVEALIVVFVLAIVPYFLIRGPADRVGRWWHERSLRESGQTGE
jgi:hypothetical protein